MLRKICVISGLPPLPFNLPLDCLLQQVFENNLIFSWPIKTLLAYVSRAHYLYIGNLSMTSTSDCCCSLLHPSPTSRAIATVLTTPGSLPSQSLWHSWQQWDPKWTWYQGHLHGWATCPVSSMGLHSEGSHVWLMLCCHQLKT